ncbi:MAG: cyclase, partial [Gammaproteobacteria bacterium]|nr:adenylate/guanylate cyclase domain-containing protein [Gemmatimonadota bacterium]NIU72935.1 cyclase [Gammaproteobacteria bacterium]NIX19146.1 cyclase [Actinomycetota bacterium]
VRMQEAMAELNRRRAGRREDPIHLNIGISTGEAVAGNMGSPSRLNYTVLGETVNLAARLSEAAKDGETLMSSSTRRRVA